MSKDAFQEAWRDFEDDTERRIERERRDNDEEVQRLKRAFPAPSLHDITLDRDMKVMEEYLQVCIRNRDWHGASDCCNDIRVLEAKRR